MNKLLEIGGMVSFMIGASVWAIADTTTIEFAFGFMIGGLYLLALREK